MSSASLIPHQNANHRVVYTPFGGNGVKILRADNPIVHPPTAEALVGEVTMYTVPWLCSPLLKHISFLAFSCLEVSNETSFLFSVG